MADINSIPPVEGLEADKKSPVDNPIIPSENDVVKYSSYKKVLNEKKALGDKHADALAKLADYEAKDRDIQQQMLIDEKNFGEVLTVKDQELERLSNELNESRRNEQDYRKMTGFLSGLGTSKLESKYYSLVPLDEIKLEDDGTIDQSSLIETVAKFKTDHSRLIVDQRNDLPPHKVGDSTGKKLSVKEWKALASSKEMKDRYNEVDWATA